MKSKYFLSPKALFAVCFVLLLCAGSGFAAKKITESFSIENESVLLESFDKDEKNILRMINEERRNHRLNQLVLDSSLNRLARAYSNKMARESFFSHRDTSGKNLVQRARDYNINGWRGIAENLYKCKGFDDPAKAAVRGWLKSPAHRSNFLSRNWSATGIGIAESSDGTVYVTQIFLQR